MSDLGAYLQEYGETNIPLNLSLDLVTEMIGALNDADRLHFGDDLTKTAFSDLRRELEEQTSAAIPQFKILLDREMENENAKVQETDFEFVLPKEKIVPIEGNPAIDVKKFVEKHLAHQVTLSLPYAVIFNVLSSLNRDLRSGGLGEVEMKTVSLIHDLIVARTVEDFPECYPVHFGPIAPASSPTQNN